MFKSNGYAKPGFNAIYRTATDPRIGWTECSPTVIKTIIFMTHCYSQLGEEKKYTLQPLGDGKDTCKDTRHPTMQETDRFLSLKNVNLFFLIIDTGRTDIGKDYLELAKQLSVHHGSVYCKQNNPNVQNSFLDFVANIEKINKCQICGQ